MPTVEELFEVALAELRFDEAARLVADSSDPGLHHRLETERRSATESAHELASSISAQARQHDYLALLDIGDDPTTENLLELLPASTRKRAEIHLRGARHWAQRQIESNRRRLEEARTALDQLDLVLARSIVKRLEDRFLGEDEIELRDRLLLDIAARAMEADELAAAESQVLAEEQPVSRRWWRRKRGG